MLSDAQSTLYTRPALALFPGALIALTVACVNALGHALRNADPAAPPTA
jgi:ABC-type dipeptide/oligopeptide/nickel transport system permease subunit